MSVAHASKKGGPVIGIYGWSTLSVKKGLRGTDNSHAGDDMLQHCRDDGNSIWRGTLPADVR
jgi:hypothetical protein